MSYFKKQQNGVLLLVYVQPGAKTQEITGLHGERVKIRIQAPPTDNQANQEVISFLTSFLGLSKYQVSIVRGEKNRNKDVLLDMDVEKFLEKFKPAIEK